MLNFQGPRGGCKSNGIDLKFSRLSYFNISNNQKKIRSILRRLGELQHPNGEAGINLEIELEVGIRNSCKKGTTKKSIWEKQVLKEIKRFFNLLKNFLLASR